MTFGKWNSTGSLTFSDGDILFAENLNSSLLACVPIGGIIKVGEYTPKSTIGSCFKYCNGTTLSDSDSPLNGSALPNLGSFYQNATDILSTSATTISIPQGVYKKIDFSMGGTGTEQSQYITLNTATGNYTNYVLYASNGGTAVEQTNSTSSGVGAFLTGDYGYTIVGTMSFSTNFAVINHTHTYNRSHASDYAVCKVGNTFVSLTASPTSIAFPSNGVNHISVIGHKILTGSYFIRVK
jgi:hypothetical protein